MLVRLRRAGEIRRRTRNLRRRPPASAAASSGPADLFLGLSFHIAAPERLAMLAVAVPQSLAALGSSGLPLRVTDASDTIWSERARLSLEAITGIGLQYQSCPGPFPQHWQGMLREAREPFFCMLFEDQALFGLTPSFLGAACQLLRDYRGLVDLIHIDWEYPRAIDPASRTIVVDLAAPAWKQQRQTPLVTVTYGEHTFDILPKWAYGFIADNLIASRPDYLRRLEWYMANVSGDNIHAIELAALSLRVGPIYHFYAVPRRVFRLDLDFHHTAAAVRGQVGPAREVYQALRAGYRVEGRSTSNSHVR